MVYIIQILAYRLVLLVFILRFQMHKVLERKENLIDMREEKEAVVSNLYADEIIS